MLPPRQQRRREGQPRWDALRGGPHHLVGLAHDVAETYVPVTITVSYAGRDGTPKPFLLIINWLKVRNDWKIASEIILPVPLTPATKS
jgi:hypothetical protein